MNDAANMGKVSTTGSVKLLAGKIISTLLLAVGTIIVGIYISESDYGLYTIALVPATTFLLFQDLGIGSALTKYCANYRASKRTGELRCFILSGLKFEIATGVVLTLVALMAANFIAAVFGKPQSSYLIALTSITILSSGIYAYCTSILIGFERMGLSTITLIVSATVQGLISPLLVFIGLGALGAIIGYTTSSIASGVAGVALLYFAIYRKLPSNSGSKTSMRQTLKPLLQYGIPLSIATIIGGGVNQIYNFLMAHFVDLPMIGNYNIAVNFAIFVTFITYPLQTVLFPTFSKIDSLKDKQLLKTIYTSSVKYSSLFLVPVTVALMVLSSPLIQTIYGEKWLSAPSFLTLFVAGNLVVLLGNLSFNRLLYAMGETKMLMKLNILTLCTGVPLATLMIPSLGILGLIIVGYLVPPGITLLVGIYWTWKHYETKPDFGNSARILLAAATAGLVTYLFLSIFAMETWLMLIIGIALLLSVYLVTIPLFGAVNQTDIDNLRFMFSGIKLISKIMKIPFFIVDKVIKIKHKL